MCGNTAARVEGLAEEMGCQALEQAEMHRTSRREMFAVRDLLGDKMQANEVNLNAGTAAIVEAKFAQLEGFITQLQGHFVSLYERETAVEGVVAQDEATVESAFAYVDGKINQVGEIVKRFETAGAPSVPGVTAPFIVKMRESMHAMHTKLLGLDGEVLLAIQEQTVPMCDQLATLRNQVNAQYEQIGILTVAVTEPYPTSGTCGPCEAANPWTAAASGPCTCGPGGYAG